MNFFTASDGARIAYRDEGAGTPIVLLHGLMAHGGFFREQRGLTGRFRVISVDLRGHGASRGDGQRPTVGQLADDVAGLAAALGLEGAVGVGWSLGATILWHVLAGPAGGRFAGAVVVDMTARVCNGADWDLGLSPEACQARTDAIRDDFETFAVNAGQAIFAQPIDGPRRTLADWASFEFARNDSEAIGAVWASLMEEDARRLLGRIAHPTLIVRGAHSQLYGPGTADHLAAALPHARIVAFDASGHAPHLEQPDLFNQVIRDFADQLAPAPGAQRMEI
ncbi:MAG: alpha/beta fold hydrolase [Allosphingosinicella sp.]|uniref:alpha/beta fold hydrolase n=1 Tax=Allosphingosinicella sp. TaxID=2823234 RepID=UPI00394F1C95